MRLTIPAKVLSGFAAVLLTFGLVTAFSIYQLHRVGVGLSLVSNTYHPLTRLTAQLDASYRDSSTATERLLRETDIDTRRGLLNLALEYHPRAAREKLKAAQGVMKEARAAEPGAREQGFLDRIDVLLDGILARYDAYQRTGALAGEVLNRLEVAKHVGVNTSTIEAEFDAIVRELKKAEEAIGSSLKDLASELDDRIDQRVQQAGNEERQSVLLIIGFSLLAVSVGVFITLATQRILAPIRRLTEAVKDIGEGQFARELAVHSDDELALLAREFNAMARKLRDRDRQLQEKTAEVLRAERLAAVGRLAAQITHEIRNPLSSLSLNTELLQERLEGGIDDAAGRSEAHGLLRSMAREMDRLAEITEEYLRFARQPKPAMEPVDLNDSVDELVDFMLPELAKGGVTATRELTDLEPRVRADPGQLRQVLLNLVRNAREAAGPGGRILIRTRSDAAKGVARLEVEDNGPGIPSELKDRLFEPFFSTKERGTGLGLAVVQQIVHEHGGEVACQPLVSRGTVFSVTLPLAETAEARARLSESEVAPLPASEGR